MNKKFKFKELLTPNGEAKVELFLNQTEKVIDLNEIIKNYRISKMWAGKFFIKRLIKKIFKNKLNKKYNWKNNFWDNNEVLSFKSKYHIEYKLDEFSKIICNNTTASRYKDIINYQKLISKGVDLGSPLYISSESLNYLGANLNNDNIYILDGSRRLISNILSNKSPDILLIDYKYND